VVPAAWTLLLPIAWWADTRLRRQALIAVAVLALAVQVVGASAQYARYIGVVQRLSGVPIYKDREGVPLEKIPYGDDPTRWFPELSPILLQAEGLISSQVLNRFGQDGITATYAPFEGRSRSVNLSDPEVRMELDYWWYAPLDTPAARLIALLMFGVGGAAAFGLYRVARTGPLLPPRAPPPGAA
jgi:hypothetical protein